MKRKIIFFILLLLLVVGLSIVLIYREYSPENQKAIGNIYYLSPTGNDTNNGSTSSPWKTIAKADSVVQAGDTVIFKDGIYPVGYDTGKSYGERITKSKTTWKAENKHKAIIDGELGPESFKGRPHWDVLKVYKENISQTHQWYNMVYATDVTDITFDGLAFVNSPGRGLTIHQATQEAPLENIVVKDCWFDFNWDVSFLIVPYKKNTSNNAKIKNIVFERNLITRGAIFKWTSMYRDPVIDESFANWPGPIATSGSQDIIIKNSIFAWNHGENQNTHGSLNQLFENNIVINSELSFYVSEGQNAIARSNLIVADLFSGDKSYFSSLGIPWISGGIVSTRESSQQGIPEDFNNQNISIYNNVLIGVDISFIGAFPNWWQPGNPLEYRDQKGIYVGNNTIVVNPLSKTHCSGKRKGSIVCFNNFLSSKNNKISGIFENNLFVTEQLGNDKANLFTISSDQGGFNMATRNNLIPQGADNGGGAFIYPKAIVNNNSGVVDANAPFTLVPPEMLGGRDDFKSKVEGDVVKTKAYVNNLKLKADSPARDTGSTAGAANGVTPPMEARTRDFYGNLRDSKPDIGAIEFGGGEAEVSPTSRVGATEKPQPTSVIMPGVECGGADVDGNGKFTIRDFGEFANMYKKECNDKHIDYGICGHKDVDKNGIIEISDFLSFAQRYFPKESCSL